MIINIIILVINYNKKKFLIKVVQFFTLNKNYNPTAGVLP